MHDPTLLVSLVLIIKGVKEIINTLKLYCIIHSIVTNSSLSQFMGHFLYHCHVYLMIFVEFVAIL